jgi:hypothetical protein
MSWVRALLLGGVLAGLLSGQTPLAVAEILRYSLEETPEQIRRGLGAPVQIAEANAGYVSWSYKTDVLDQHEFSHVLIFEKAQGKLVSVTRNFHTAVSVDALLPEKSSRTYYWPSETDRQWAVRVRQLGEDRLVIGMGVRRAGDATTQVLVIRRSVLRMYLPWLAERLGIGS